MKILLLLKMLLLPWFQMNLLSPSSGSKMQEYVPMNVGNHTWYHNPANHNSNSHHSENFIFQQCPFITKCQSRQGPKRVTIKKLYYFLRIKADSLQE